MRKSYLPKKHRICRITQYIITNTHVLPPRKRKDVYPAGSNPLLTPQDPNLSFRSIVCQSCIITRYPTYLLPSNRVICYDCLRPRYIHRHPQILYSDNTPEPVIERAATQSRTRSSAKGVVRSISPQNTGEKCRDVSFLCASPETAASSSPHYVTFVPCVDRIGVQVQMQDPRSLPIIIPHHSDLGGGGLLL
jgi:hypothetical protein